MLGDMDEFFWVLVDPRDENPEPYFWSAWPGHENQETPRLFRNIYDAKRAIRKMDVTAPETRAVLARCTLTVGV